MTQANKPNLLLIVLAVLGALALIVLLGMWLMGVGMMGGTGMSCCGTSGWLIGLLVIAALVVVVLLLLSRRPMS